MNNLKFKLGLFSLLAVLAVSVFLTSCEQTEIIDRMEEQVSDAHNKLLLMPHGFETLNEEKQVEYLENLTEEDHAKLAENHRVGSYLRLIGKYWELYDRMEEGQLVSEIDLNRILSDEEVVALQNYQYDIIKERFPDCGSWSLLYSYSSSYGTRCTYTRSCKELTLPTIRFWTEYESNNTCTTPSWDSGVV